jgi:hypothetical protein
MKKFHEISNINFQEEYFHITIDGTEKRYKIKDISKTLGNASEKEKNVFEISPSGYGIYWPLLDEDISIDGLLGIVHKKVKKSA